MDGGYYVAFDLAASGYKAWTSLGPGLIILLVGAFLPTLIPIPWPWSRRGVRAVGWIIAIFSGAWTAFSFWVTYAEYTYLAGRLAAGRYQTVEGTVENYEQDRTDEKFTVGGVAFTYSDFRVTSAFNNTAIEGGPIRPGLYVRIAYVDGKILRLEIRT